MVITKICQVPGSSRYPARSPVPNRLTSKLSLSPLPKSWWNILMSPKTIYKYHYHYNAIQHSYEVITSSCYCGAQCAPYLRLLLLISSQFKLSIVSTDKWLAKSQFNRELDSRHIETCLILNHETLKRRAFPMIHLSLVFTWIQKAKHGDWKQFNMWGHSFWSKQKVLIYLQIAMFSGGQKIYKQGE